jgi:hypothetical protein
MDSLEELEISYRSRAIKLRALAEIDKCEHTREMLRSVADDYDEMAETAAAIGRTYDCVQQPGNEFREDALPNDTRGLQYTGGATWDSH